MQGVLLELNDCGVRCINGSNAVISPGYALLAEGRIFTGDQAREKVFVSPQRSFSQFWQQLNLSPLPVKSPLARHNADLAYAHLLDVLKAAGQPEQITLAVPGSFSREQLGILLGLAQAAKVRVNGLVDSALLDAHQLPEGDYWHLDIQLHQLVATQITVTDQIRRGEVIMQPALGLRILHDLWAHVIANQFISQYRYDPLHHAQGEQQLHDRLSDWLEKLQDSPEISVALASAQGDYQLNLNRAALIGVASDRFKQLKLQLETLPDCRVVLSHRLAALPGLREIFASPAILDTHAVIQGFAAHAANLPGEADAVRLVTELTAMRNGQADSSDGKENPQREIAADVSHLLYRGVAWPLAENLRLDSSTGELRHDSGSAGQLLQNQGGKWYLLTNNSENPPGFSEHPLRSGDQINLDGHLLTLIRVAG